MQWTGRTRVTEVSVAGSPGYHVTVNGWISRLACSDRHRTLVDKASYLAELRPASAGMTGRERRQSVATSCNNDPGHRDRQRA